MTAEKLIESIYTEGSGPGGDSYNYSDIKRVMIKFAKYHVEQALKAASEKAEVECLDYDDYQVDKDSILNAYPLEKIK